MPDHVSERRQRSRRRDGGGRTRDRPSGKRETRPQRSRGRSSKRDRRHDKGSKKGKSRRPLCIGLTIVTLLAIGAAVAVAVVMTRDDGDDDEANNKSQQGGRDTTTTTTTTTPDPAIFDIGGVPITRSTRLGDVKGLDTDKGLAFRSIEYARASRFAFPLSRKDTTHDGVLDLTQRPPGCPQPSTDEVATLLTPQQETENCLYLSIYAPKDATSASNLPVIVYLHGGNNDYLYGDSPLFDGRNFASKNQVVFVTINYRLGFLGFAYLDGGSTANLGLRDMIKALEWVRDNIADYGGDPAKVTLMGQGSGAQAALLLMANDEASPLFRAVIAQSPQLGIPELTPDQATSIAERVASALGCEATDMACLRNLATSAIIQAQSSCVSCAQIVSIIQQRALSFPVIDNDLVKTSIQDYFKNNAVTKPIMFGFNEDEGHLYTYEVIPELPLQLIYFGLLGLYKSCCVTQLGVAYPPQPDGTDSRASLVPLVGDLVFRCLTRDLSVNSQLPTWIYSFGITPPAEISPGGDTCTGKACHGSDLGFSFGNLDDLVPSASVTSAMKQAEDFLVESLGNFVRDLDPGTVSPAATWEPFDALSENVMFIADTLAQSGFPDVSRCDLLNDIGYGLDDA